jgi:hypothetical protein
MLATMKKYLFIVAFGLVCGIFVYCPAHATYYTVSALGDAGIVYGQPDYASLTGTISGVPTTFIIPSTTPINNKTDVQNIAALLGMSAWTLNSAGNIYDPAKTNIGVTTGPLAAGTYRISVATDAASAFTYDSFDWTATYYNRYLWFLQIMSYTTVSGLGVYQSYTLGTDTLYSSLNDAWNGNKTLSTTVTLAGPNPALFFWIYDVNSLDNLGSLRFNVEVVPLPSSLLLALAGLPAMALFRVRRCIRRR